MKQSPYTNGFVELNLLEAALADDEPWLYAFAARLTESERRQFELAIARIDDAFDDVKPEEI